MVNKFLYPKGGSETYMIKLGEYLKKQGHQVQYFGMEHPDRSLYNQAEVYTSNMDMHTDKIGDKLLYALKTVYSKEARVKIRKILDVFKPHIIHLNNFNYQLTPSIILEIKKWRKEARRKCKIVYTAHDYQLICPNHLLYSVQQKHLCEKCIGGHFIKCLEGKCIHGSRMKSIIGMAEAYFWNWNGVYKYIDSFICCSSFIKKKMDCNPIFSSKTVVLHNFIDINTNKCFKKKEYVLFFGRYSIEKGIETLLDVCRELPHISFVFAGAGPLEKKLKNISNIINIGFLTGEQLYTMIGEALFTIYPSEWYENCPFSVMESQALGTPVIGADIGGIPELIQPGKTGELFLPGDKNDLKKRIEKLWYDRKRLNEYYTNCKENKFLTIEEYTEKLMKIYKQKKGEGIYV